MSTVVANGLVIGSIYGLVALGLSLVFKKSRVLNFAHAETGMVGAFVFFVLSVEQGWPYLVAAAAAVATSAALGLGTYLVLLRRREEPLNMLIGSVGVAGVLLFAANEIWGPDQHFVPPPVASAAVELFGVRLAGPRLVVVVASAVLAAGFFALFRATRMAVLFRASADDPYAATLMGVDVVRLDATTWALAGALAGAAGVLVAPLVGFDIFFMTLLSIRAFAATLVAGLGNVAAAGVAGVGIGLAEATLVRVTTRPGLPEALLVVLIVLVLLLRPDPVGRRTA